MRRILFFAIPPYPTDRVSLVTLFTQLLPQAGYEVEWIFEPRKPEFSGVETDWNGTRVHVVKRRLWMPGLRHAEQLIRFARLGDRIAREQPVDLIFARTGLLEAYAAWWTARRHGKPFVFYYTYPRYYALRDWFNDRRVPFAGALALRLARALTGFVMRRAALVLPVSDEMAAFWRARGVKRIEAFPMGGESSNLDDIAPVDAPPRTVIYFGTMIKARKFGFLLDVFARVLRDVPDAHLLMVGDQRNSGLPEYAERLGIAHAVTFTGLVPHATIGRYIRAARCSIAPYPPERPFIEISPTKAIESLAFGVPVVGNCEVSQLRDIIEQSGGGYAPCYDAGEFAEAVVHLLRDPEDAARRGQRGREWILEHQSYEVLAQKLIAAVEKLLPSNRQSQSSAAESGETAG